MEEMQKEGGVLGERKGEATRNAEPITNENETKTKETPPTNSTSPLVV